MLKDLIYSTKALIKEHFNVFVIFWILLLILDLLNYFAQFNYGYSEESSRYIEMSYQLLLVFYSVCFFHKVSSIEQGRFFSLSRLMGESLLLTPGFILQTIFFLITFTLGTVLLIVPGVCALFIFYFAPILAVIYPDYNGRIFILSKNIFMDNWKSAVVVILFTTILPLIPDGIVWFSSGALKSPLTPFFAPIDGALFIFCETMLLCFLFPILKQYRAK